MVNAVTTRSKAKATELAEEYKSQPSTDTDFDPDNT